MSKLLKKFVCDGGLMITLAVAGLGMAANVALENNRTENALAEYNAANKSSWRAKFLYNEIQREIPTREYLVPFKSFFTQNRYNPEL